MKKGKDRRVTVIIPRETNGVETGLILIVTENEFIKINSDVEGPTLNATKLSPGKYDDGVKLALGYVETYLTNFARTGGDNKSLEYEFLIRTKRII